MNYYEQRIIRKLQNDKFNVDWVYTADAAKLLNRSKKT